jgi:hypothetical protein
LNLIKKRGNKKISNIINEQGAGLGGALQCSSEFAVSLCKK